MGLAILTKGYIMCPIDMPEEFNQIKTEVAANIFPIAIGAAAILLVAVGIYLFASRPQPKQERLPEQVVVETPIDLSQGQPSATSPLAGFTTPTPSPRLSPAPSVKPQTLTKGGQLPKSGFPMIALIPVSLLLLGGGVILRRKI